MKKHFKYLPKKEKQRIIELIEKIRSEATSGYTYIPDKDIKKIKIGTFLCTAIQAGNMGPDRDILKYIGYTCQIRLNQGYFGTNEIFLRHLDGSLTTHSNQSFFRISNKNTKKLMKLFTRLLREEKEIWDKDFFYNSFEGIKKYGYLVEEEA